MVVDAARRRAAPRRGCVQQVEALITGLRQKVGWAYRRHTTRVVPTLLMNKSSAPCTKWVLPSMARSTLKRARGCSISPREERQVVCRTSGKEAGRVPPLDSPCRGLWEWWEVGGPPTREPVAPETTFRRILRWLNPETTCKAGPAAKASPDRRWQSKASRKPSAVLR